MENLFNIIPSGFLTAYQAAAITKFILTASRSFMNSMTGKFPTGLPEVVSGMLFPYICWKIMWNL